MTNYQAFIMGITTALVPSFAVLVLLFLRSCMPLGGTFILTQPAMTLQIIRGGKEAVTVGASRKQTSAYHHLVLVESVSVIPTQDYKAKPAQTSASEHPG